MKRISYCTVCKGRLWQLKQTLPINILKTDKYTDIVLLNYHSDDGLGEYIEKNFKEYLNNGQLKYYNLNTPIEGFDMAYAKHLVHQLAEGDVLFNLDADNYIGDTCRELRALKSGHLLLPKPLRGTQTSRCGRLGFHKTDYEALGGYNVEHRGVDDDDGDMVRRAWNHGIRFTRSRDMSIPVQQTEADKQQYVMDVKPELPQVVNVTRSVNKLLTVQEVTMF